MFKRQAGVKYNAKKIVIDGIIPLETIEQQTLVHWLEINNYKYTSIPNSTYTESYSQKRKNKAEWLKPWLPDLLIILKRWSLLFIELKRSKKSLSKVSKEQKEWIEALSNISNVEAQVCYGAIEWIELIKKLELK